jgi:hypothetical protein
LAVILMLDVDTWCSAVEEGLAFFDEDM